MFVEHPSTNTRTARDRPISGAPAKRLALARSARWHPASPSVFFEDLAQPVAYCPAHRGDGHLSRPAALPTTRSGPGALSRRCLLALRHRPTESTAPLRWRGCASCDPTRTPARGLCPPSFSEPAFAGGQGDAEDPDHLPVQDSPVGRGQHLQSQVLRVRAHAPFWQQAYSIRNLL